MSILHFASKNSAFLLLLLLLLILILSAQENNNFEIEMKKKGTRIDEVFNYLRLKELGKEHDLWSYYYYESCKSSHFIALSCVSC